MAIADSFFYRPTQIAYDDPRDHGLAFEDVFFDSSDGVRLHGWFFPATTGETAAGAGTDAVGTVVHAHGNAGNVSGHFPMIGWLPAAGFNVLTFDYRGYGRSSGRITRRGMIDDIGAATAYARGRDDVDADRVVLFGQSIGAATACVAAAEQDLGVRGLCLDGPFSSYQVEARFVTRQIWYYWAMSPLIARFLTNDDWSARDYVARLPAVPKLFIGGRADPIVDVRQVEALHGAASEPKELWVTETGHCDVVRGEDDAGRRRVAAFFRECVG